ncbi:MAG: serine/threonine protein kinase [Kofleriaceae bacterium]|nr:serine/threonine protein kinase [Kofleriaceae bacterium]
MESLISLPAKALGDYELLYEIKSGGMGQIYLARKHGTGGFEKLVAIKTILGEYSAHPELRTMFLDEARLLSRLDHPAIAQVHDFGEQDDMLFLAMEYIAGVRFGDLRQLGAPPGLIVRAIAQVCRALHAAHTLQDIHGEPLNIVHRDVSPDNLMFSFDGNVKVLDFGIALIRGRQAPVTEYGAVKGKPPYLSPEQLKGEPLDGRSDIWSIGVVLWELLVGEHLFDGDSIYAIARAVDEQVIDSPSTRTGFVSPELDAVVAKALARDPEKRYPSAQHMASDLERLAAKMQAPSCAEFASQLLGEERAKHKLWLRSILVGDKVAPEAPTGRPEGLATVAGPGPTPLAEPKAESIARELTLGPSKTSSAPVWLLALLALSLAGGGIWIFSSLGEPAIASQVLADAGAGQIAPLDSGNIVDASAAENTKLAAIQDAAMSVSLVPDAKVKRRTNGGRTRTKITEVSKPKEPKEQVKPPPKKDPPPAVGFGTVTIAANPFALVRIDGKEVGSTPIFNRKLSAGKHTVTLIHPDTGAVRLRKSFNLAADGHRKVIAR